MTRRSRRRGDDRQRAALTAAGHAEIPAVPLRQRCQEIVGAQRPDVDPAIVVALARIQPERGIAAQAAARQAVVDLLRLDDRNAVDPDLEGDEPARGELRQAAIRPHASARNTEDRRILASRARHAEDAVQPARARGQPDVLEVDLRAVHLRRAVVGKRRPLRVERQRRQALALRVPECVEVGRVHLRRLDPLRRETGRADAAIRAPVDHRRRHQPQKARLLHRAGGDRQRRRADRCRRLGDRRQHLGANAVLHRRADGLVAVTHDIDAERDRLARLIGPVLVIRRDRDGDAAERLPDLLGQRRGHERGEANPRPDPNDEQTRGKACRHRIHQDECSTTMASLDAAG